MAQFTPETATWLQSVCPEIGAADPWDPNWSVRAAVCYDQWLYARVSGASECDRWAFTLSSYNGGLGWLHRDKTRASASGADSARWFSNVELYSARSAAARAENRTYVREILRVLEPVYIAAGWPGVCAC
jgi:membrane-bound lytic murein transglycosylase MltF